MVAPSLDPGKAGSQLEGTGEERPGKVKVPTGQERVRVLYEEYIHYAWLKEVWDNPVSSRPELEPLFAAGFQGIELAFLLMAQFVEDSRTYVGKRPRIEAMALDIRAQCQLLGELVDGELEEEGATARLSLTQDFPFEGCPPTTSCPGYSPGLAAVLRGVRRTKDLLSPAERNSLIKVALMISSSLHGTFQRWTVGLGIEHQVNALLKELGLGERYMIPERQHNLDYNALVRPQVAEATLSLEEYTNEEDFFFRTIHLGTECWMFIANSRARSARQAAGQAAWHVASARIMQVARILHYLGDHILTLTRMNLRDYLQLKVQLEGTSGAGSSQVRAIKGLVLGLMEPLRAELLQLARQQGQQRASLGGAPGGGGAGAEQQQQGGGEEEDEEDLLLRGVMHVYIHCDEYAGLYNYAKSLEDVESGLLGGFYYKHYCLAANVIGSEARGTMRRAVGALKAGYERALFPVLDAARSLLGQRYDQQLSHLKGRMMDEIIERYTRIGTSTLPRNYSSPRHLAALAGGQASADSFSDAAVAGCPYLGHQDLSGPGATREHVNGSAAAAAAVNGSGRLPGTASRAETHRALSIAAAAAADALGQAPLTPLPPGTAHLLVASSVERPGCESEQVSATLQQALSGLLADSVLSPQHSNRVSNSSGDGANGHRSSNAGVCPFLASLGTSQQHQQDGNTHSGISAPSPALPPNTGHLSEANGHGGSSGSMTVEPASGKGEKHCIPPVPASSAAVSASGLGEGGLQPGREQLRSWLYSHEGLPSWFTSWAQQSLTCSLREARAAGVLPAAAPAEDSTQPNGNIVEASTIQQEQQQPICFLDHAWGAVSPRVLLKALERLVGLQQLGNPTWDLVFGQIMPQGGEHVRHLLGVDNLRLGSSQPSPHVHWGSNSHELVWRLISCHMGAAGGTGKPVRILTSDTEFYSFTRQINRLATAVHTSPEQPTGTTAASGQGCPPQSPHGQQPIGSGLHGVAAEQNGHGTGYGGTVEEHRPAESSLLRAPLGFEVDVVPAQPADTFVDRLVEFAASSRRAGAGPQVVYVSQITFLQQQTLIQDVSGFVTRLAAALDPGPVEEDSTSSGTSTAAGAGGASDTQSLLPPLILVDGYHALGAVPTDLKEALSCEPIASGRVAFGYVAGVLKHLGCGPNAACVLLAPGWDPQPLITGWLADPSVLSPGSAGIRPGSPAGFFPPLALQGGTPAFLLPMLTFNALMETWAEAGTVAGLEEQQQLSSSGQPGLSVADAHGHVLQLQQQFLRSLPADQGSVSLLGRSQLVNLAAEGAEGTQSHTLVFKCASPAEAATVVRTFAERGIVVDTRQQYVRLGFGFNHSQVEVERLISACQMQA